MELKRPAIKLSCNLIRSGSICPLSNPPAAIQHCSTLTCSYNCGNHFPHPLTPLTRGKVSFSASSCRRRTRLCVMQWSAYGSLSSMDTSLEGQAEPSERDTLHTLVLTHAAGPVMHWIHLCRRSSTDSTYAGGPLPIPLMQEVLYRFHLCRRSSTDSTYAGGSLPIPLMQEVLYRFHLCRRSSTDLLMQEVLYRFHLCKKSSTDLLMQEVLYRFTYAGGPLLVSL